MKAAFRRLAEHALEKLQGPLAFEGGPWTEAALLPGGDPPLGDVEQLRCKAAAHYPWLLESTLTRVCHAYGTRIDAVLAGAKARSDLGEDHGAG